MRKASLRLAVFFLGFWLVFGLVFRAYAGSQATSGVTVQTIIDRAAVDLGESISASGTFWLTTDVVQWVNEAVKEINYRTRLLETAATTITLANDDYQYDITGSYTDIEAVLYDSGTTDDKQRIYTLERTEIKSIGHSKEIGRPKFYAIWNDDLYIWPVPHDTSDVTISGTTLYLFVVSAPSGVTETTSAIETPAYFDDAILAYVKGKACLVPSSGMEAHGIYWLRRFDAYIEEYLAKILKRVP